jgi:manganese/zinc/iron transport system permease protein
LDWFSWLNDYTLRNVSLGAALLGLVGGVLGSFAVLRKQSLLGDVLAHAALPGICIAFMLTSSKVPLVLLVGGGIAGWLASLLVLAIIRSTKLPADSALGVVLSSFFGFGVALLTFIQDSNNANQAGLDKFIFGQAATIVESDIWTFILLGGFGLAVVLGLYKEFKLLSFDPAYASSLGLPVPRLGVWLTSLTVLAVMIGIQTVGVVLMAAMLITPAIAARQWTHRLDYMVWLSGGFGAFAGLFGALLSSTRENLPTGPVIVLAASAIMVFSLFFAPLGGVFWQWLRTRQNRSRLYSNRLLLDAQVLHNHQQLTLANYAQRRRESLSVAAKHLNFLQAQGWLTRSNEIFGLTPAGDEQAQALKRAMQERL